MPTGNSSRPDDTNWTGAKIKSCCRLASLLDVPLVQAAQNVVPVAVTVSLLRTMSPAIATPMPIQYHQIPSTITVGGSSSTSKNG